MGSQRTRTKGLLVPIFKPVEEDDRGLKKCCEKVLALASSTDTDPFFNDFKTVFFKKSSPTDNCYFELFKGGVKIADLDNSTFGTFVDFGDIEGQEDWTYFKLDWRNVLLIEGTGDYFIRRNISNLGLPAIPDDTLCYQLREFSFELADRTVKIESVHDGVLVGQNLDFKGLELRDMIRVSGYFGERQDKIVQDNVIRSNNRVVQLRNDNFPTYTFKSELLNYFATDELRNFHFRGYPIYISDYNKHNHSYQYKDFGVVYDSPESTKYLKSKRSRKAIFGAKFTELDQNNRKINY